MPGAYDSQPQGSKTQAYDSTTREDILERFVNGDAIADILTDPDMPSKATFSRWVSENEVFHLPKVDEWDPDEEIVLEADGKGFGDRFREAIEARTMLDIADTRAVVRDRTRDQLDDGSANPTAVSRDKLIADHTLKVAERLLKHYAPRQKLTTEDADGQDQPLQIAAPMRVPSDSGD